MNLCKWDCNDLLNNDFVHFSYFYPPSVKVQPSPFEKVSPTICHIWLLGEKPTLCTLQNIHILVTTTITTTTVIITINILNITITTTKTIGSLPSCCYYLHYDDDYDDDDDYDYHDHHHFHHHHLTGRRGLLLAATTCTVATSTTRSFQTLPTMLRTPRIMWTGGKHSDPPLHWLTAGIQECLQGHLLPTWSILSRRYLRVIKYGYCSLERYKGQPLEEELHLILSATFPNLQVSAEYQPWLYIHSLHIKTSLVTLPCHQPLELHCSNHDNHHMITSRSSSS